MIHTLCEYLWTIVCCSQRPKMDKKKTRISFAGFLFNSRTLGNWHTKTFNHSNCIPFGISSVTLWSSHGYGYMDRKTWRRYVGTIEMNIKKKKELNQINAAKWNWNWNSNEITYLTVSLCFCHTSVHIHTQSQTLCQINTQKLCIITIATTKRAKFIINN